MAHASEEVPPSVHELDLGQVVVRRCLGVLAVDVVDSVDRAAIAHCDGVVQLARNVNHTLKLDVLPCETLFHGAGLSLFELGKVVEENIAVLRAARETHIVLLPVDSTNLLLVIVALIILVTLLSVEIEKPHAPHVSRASRAGDHVSTVAELNLTAVLDS